MARESAASRRARVKLQLRDKEGKWIEMGGGVKWFSKSLGRYISGTVKDIQGSNAVVTPTGQDKGKRDMTVPGRNVSTIETKATLNAPAAPTDKTMDKMLNDKKAGPENPAQEQPQKAVQPKAPAPVTSKIKISETKDGAVYFGKEDGTSLYSPASELEVGDKVVAPKGASDKSPFAVGSNWVENKVVAVDKAGLGVGTVRAKDDSSVTVSTSKGKKLSDGTSESKVSKSKKVVKAPQEVQDLFGDTEPEDTGLEDLDAPETIEENIDVSLDEDLGEDAVPVEEKRSYAPVVEETLPEGLNEAGLTADEQTALDYAQKMQEKAEASGNYDAVDRYEGQATLLKKLGDERRKRLASGETPAPSKTPEEPAIAEDEKYNDVGLTDAEEQKYNDLLDQADELPEGSEERQKLEDEAEAINQLGASRTGAQETAEAPVAIPEEPKESPTVPTESPGAGKQPELDLGVPKDRSKGVAASHKRALDKLQKEDVATFTNGVGDSRTYIKHEDRSWDEVDPEDYDNILTEALSSDTIADLHKRDTVAVEIDPANEPDEEDKKPRKASPKKAPSADSETTPTVEEPPATAPKEKLRADGLPMYPKAYSGVRGVNPGTLKPGDKIFAGDRFDGFKIGDKYTDDSIAAHVTVVDTTGGSRRDMMTVAFTDIKGNLQHRAVSRTSFVFPDTDEARAKSGMPDREENPDASDKVKEYFADYFGVDPEDIDPLDARASGQRVADKKRQDAQAEVPAAPKTAEPTKPTQPSLQERAAEARRALEEGSAEKVVPETVPEDSTTPSADSSGAFPEGVIRRTPEALPEENYPPTQQQQDVIDAVLGGLDTKVQAKAGSGKTSTIQAIARRMMVEQPDKKALYVVFNSSVKKEADEKMKNETNVEARTSHSLGWKWAPLWMRNRGPFKARGLKKGQSEPIKLSKPVDIAGHLGIMTTLRDGTSDPMSNKEQVDAALSAVDRFANSADDSISFEHFESGVELSAETQNVLVGIANKIWEDVNTPEGKIKISMDHMRKAWALSKPDFSEGIPGSKGAKADIVFIDEAQDTAPVMAKVIADQKIQKVIVGDQDQSIYQFTGATDYLTTAEADIELPLNKSWRFGPEIADVGNRFLEMKGAPDRVVGGGPSSTISEHIENPDAILVRSNSGMFDEIVREQGKDRIVGVPSGTKSDLVRLISHAAALQNGWDIRDPHEDLARYSTWAEVTAAAEDKSDPKASKISNLVMIHGTKGLKDILNNVVEQSDGGSTEGLSMEKTANGTAAVFANRNDSFKFKDYLKQAGFKWFPKEKQWTAVGTPEQQEATVARVADIIESPVVPDVTISTAHKAKGLEWGSVRIGDDFRGPEIDEITGETKMPSESELNLAYVAVTRAEKELSIGSLGYVFDYTTENGGIAVPRATTPAPGAEKVDRQEQESQESVPASEDTEEEIIEDVIEDNPESSTPEDIDSIVEESAEEPEQSDTGTEEEAVSSETEEPTSSPESSSNGTAEEPAPAVEPVIEEDSEVSGPEETIEAPEEEEEPEIAPSPEAAPEVEDVVTPDVEEPEETPNSGTAAEEAVEETAPDPADYYEAESTGIYERLEKEGIIEFDEDGEITVPDRPKAVKTLDGMHEKYVRESGQYRQHLPPVEQAKMDAYGEALRDVIEDVLSQPEAEAPSPAPTPESRPETPATPEVPSVGEPTSSDAASEVELDEDGLTPEEAEKVKELGERIAEAYKGNSTEDVKELEDELYGLYDLGEERLSGESSPEPVSETMPEPAPSPDPVVKPHPPVSEPEPEPEPEPEVNREPEPPAVAPQPVPEMEVPIPKPRSTPTTTQSSGPRQKRESRKDLSPVLSKDSVELYAGDTIGHPRLGPVKLTGVTGKSQRVSFIDPKTGKASSVAAGIVSKVDPTAPVEAQTVSGGVGDRIIDPATGLKGFVTATGDILLTGDSVKNLKTGEIGKIVGVYNGADGKASVAVAWPGEANQKKRSRWSMLGAVDGETSRPAAPVAEPEIASKAPDNAFDGLNEDGLTATEAAELNDLENQLASAWSPSSDLDPVALESEINRYLDMGRSRLDGSSDGSAGSVDEKSASGPSSPAVGAYSPEYAGIPDDAWASFNITESRLNPLSEEGQKFRADRLGEISTTSALPWATFEASERANKHGEVISPGMKVKSRETGEYLGRVMSVEEDKEWDGDNEVGTGTWSVDYDINSYGPDIDTVTAFHPYDSWDRSTTDFNGMDSKTVELEMSVRFPGIKFDFSESSSDEVSVAFSSSLSRLLSKYPMIGAGLTQVQFKPGGEEGEMASASHRSFSANVLTPQKLSFAADGLKNDRNTPDMEYLAEIVQRSSETNWFNNVPQSQEMDYIVSHEFGHLLDALTGNEIHSKVYSLMAELSGMKDKSKAATRQLARWLRDHGLASRYSAAGGTIDISELIGEAFADVEVNGINANSLSKMIHHALMELLGKV